jgi:hypothetical protein
LGCEAYYLLPTELFTQYIPKLLKTIFFSVVRNILF